MAVVGPCFILFYPYSSTGFLMSSGAELIWKTLGNALKSSSSSRPKALLRPDNKVNREHAFYLFVLNFLFKNENAAYCDCDRVIFLFVCIY